MGVAKQIARQRAQGKSKRVPTENTFDLSFETAERILRQHNVAVERNDLIAIINVGVPLLHTVAVPRLDVPGCVAQAQGVLADRRRTEGGSLAETD